jgi:arylsulfatase A-like enzyme
LQLQLIYAGSILPLANYAQSVEKPNVLFITIDDMNDWTTVFDKNNPIKTPNIEKLAARGAFFT